MNLERGTWLEVRTEQKVNSGLEVIGMVPFD